MKGCAAAAQRTEVKMNVTVFSLIILYTLLGLIVINTSAQFTIHLKR